MLKKENLKSCISMRVKKVLKIMLLDHVINPRLTNIINHANKIQLPIKMT